MIHLIGDYYMTTDKQNGSCYTVGKAASCVADRLSRSSSRYYPTLASAVSGTAEIALRDKIAAGEITTLHDAVEELRRIKNEILAAIGDGEGVQ